jgi:hypothetical protein
MSMQEEASAYELGKRLYRESLGKVVSYKEIHDALVTSGLPITLDMLAELGLGYEAACLEDPCAQR